MIWYQIVLGQEVDAYARELVYMFVLCKQIIEEGRSLLKEIGDNRCATQHHAYLHMRAVGLVVYQATISVPWPMHMLCVKLLHASRTTIIVTNCRCNEDLPNQSGKLSILP